MKKKLVNQDPFSNGRCKQHILYNLQKYLDRYNEHSDKLSGITAEEYYEVWKRKGNISEYRAKKNQLRLF